MFSKTAKLKANCNKTGIRPLAKKKSKKARNDFI